MIMDGQLKGASFYSFSTASSSSVFAVLVRILFVVFGTYIDAAVHVPSIFSDNMVLQSNEKYGARSFIFGTANPKEIILVHTTMENASATYNVSANESGEWIVMLNPEKTKFQSTSISIEGETGLAVVIRNVSFGDVYLCAGESDMAFPLSLSLNASAEIQTATNFSNFFIFKTLQQSSTAPQNNVDGHWEQLSTSNVANFSAVCYLSARDIASVYSSSTPVGLIQSTFIGSRIEAWMSEKAILSCKDLTYSPNLRSTSGPNPSSIWNGMIFPFRFYTLRSVLWYQGETNAMDGDTQQHYSCMFQSMIEDWRITFGYGDFSFVFVQQPPTTNSSMASQDAVGITNIRLAQLETMPRPYCKTDTSGMAVTLDLGGESAWGVGNPPNKPEIGKRLAAAALHVAFAQQQQWNGTLRFASPTPRSVSVDSRGNVNVEFASWTAGGLALSGANLCTSCCDKSQGFDIYDNNSKIWLVANATIVGSSILIASTSSHISQVRYGFSNFVECVLKNSDGFVASPFILNVTQELTVSKFNSLKGEPILSPPMGFNSWNFYHCNINEMVIRSVAAAMIGNGMKAAGYQFVNIDDCWQVARDSNGTIVPDPVRFPSGMAMLTQDIHDLGMKFGVYTARGTLTCQGRPASLGYEVIDASTYCYDWGLDYVKIDVCQGAQNDRKSWTKFHDTFAQCFNNTKNYVVMSVESCEDPNDCGKWVASLANLWRTHSDIQATFSSILSNAKANNIMANVSSPGHFNDADMLQVGNVGLSFAEQKTHFALWCIMSSPLLAGTDLIHASNETLSILTAQELIWVNQDLGEDNNIQGVIVQDSNSTSQFSIWKKTMSSGEIVVLVVSEASVSLSVAIEWDTIGIPETQPMNLRDLWLKTNLGKFIGSYSFSLHAHDCLMVSMTPLKR
eukprot:m.64883 g.64883  ORF g.64883 m.64883 type:complete len:906 (-) comp8128_c0_seq1:94-2811(-)